MSRATLAVDRMVVLVLGLFLAAAGLALAAWYPVLQGWLTIGVTAPSDVSTAIVDDAASASWWPWALGVTGVVLVVVGLRWLTAHLPDRGVGRLRIAGSSAPGKLEVDAGAVAGAAADALNEVVGVRSARGVVRRDRGQLVATVHATIEQAADLDTVARACDAASADLVTVLGRDDLRCLVKLRVARRNRSLPRAV